MENIVSFSESVPVLFALTGVLLALRYLKGLSDFSSALNYLFGGFLCVFITKLLAPAQAHLGEQLFYFLNLFFHLTTALFMTAAACELKGIKFFNFVTDILGIGLIVGWDWYVIYMTGDSHLLMLSMFIASFGFAILAIPLWSRKGGRKAIGFDLTAWLCILLTLYNILRLTRWGQSLLPPSFETFMFIAIIGGWLLISNNMMAMQYDSLMQEIKDNKERLRLMVQLSPFPIVISRLKGDQLMLINDSAAKLFGVNPRKLSNFKMVDYFAEPNKRQELLAKLEKNPVVDDFEFQVKPRTGEPFWLLVSARVFDYEYEVALYMAFQDITDRKKKEIQLFNQATRDPLTQCYNRRQFEELSKNEVTRSRRYNHPFCLFMIDADHFKSVNDTHGHAVGDLVLQALADCCRRTLRESDIISRFGGEEFVIMLPESTLENGYRVAERLRINISKIIVKNEQNEDVSFTVSIGLVPSTVTDNVADMLKMSDEALYEAKEHGRNQVVVYGENGPDRSFTVATDERIESAKTAGPFYFVPTSQPNKPAMHNDEPTETGVVGLSGATASENEPMLDDDDDFADEKFENTGVSLNALYEDDTPSSPSPVPPPVGNDETGQAYSYEQAEYEESELPVEEPVYDTVEDDDIGYAQMPVPPSDEEELPVEEPLYDTVEDDNTGYAQMPVPPSDEESELPVEEPLYDTVEDDDTGYAQTPVPPSDEESELPVEEPLYDTAEDDDAGYAQTPVPPSDDEEEILPDDDVGSGNYLVEPEQLYKNDDSLADTEPDLPPDDYVPETPDEEQENLINQSYDDTPLPDDPQGGYTPSGIDSLLFSDGDDNPAPDEDGPELPPDIPPTQEPSFLDYGETPPPPAVKTVPPPPPVTAEPPPPAVGLQSAPSDVQPPLVVPPRKIIKKIIKMPSGMTKIPKMPGVIKMKIPKGLVTAPKPPSQN